MTGRGKTVRLVGLGDSVIDGVGCSSLGSALAARTAEALAARLGAQIEWRVSARTGANTRQVRRELLPETGMRDADFVVISTGVNDVTGLTRLRTFRAELAALLDDIASLAPAASVAVNGLPPMHVFPALPQPLRFTLGIRARQLDDVLAAAVPQTNTNGARITARGLAAQGTTETTAKMQQDAQRKQARLENSRQPCVRYTPWLYLLFASSC